MAVGSKAGSASKVKLNTFDDLFGGAENTAGEQIIHAKLADLHTFKGHPFRVLDDEKMEETTESIGKYGVLVPGIVRPRAGGGYEMIAGHRRKRGSERAGLDTMPVIVRDYTDDEATIIMVDSNIQREDILPSEKARAYAMKYEAMKHQGSRGGSTLDEVGEAAGESGKTVQRYVWLARLSDELLSAGRGYFFPDRRSPAMGVRYLRGNRGGNERFPIGKAEGVWEKWRAYACDGKADTGGGKAERKKSND